MLENSRERDVWFRRYHELIESSTKSLDEERKSRLELDYENKFLKVRYDKFNSEWPIYRSSSSRLTIPPCGGWSRKSRSC